MRALNDYVIVEVIDESVTSDNLILSGEDKKNLRARKGKILSVSKMGQEQAELKEGDEVYYDKAGSFTILVEGNERTFIRLRDIVLVV